MLVVVFVIVVVVWLGASAVLIKPIDMAIFNATMKQIIAAK